MKVGDTIKLDGKTVKIINKIAAGKYYRWYLDDGREVINLEGRDDIEIVKTKVISKSKGKKNKDIIGIDDAEYGEDLHD